MKKILAFDIGGTKIAYAIINEKGTFLNEVIKVSTPKTASGIYELLKTTIKGLEDQIDGVAIATAGTIDRNGTKITSHVGNLPKDYNKTDFANVEFTAEIYLRDEKLDDSTITVEKTENGATVSVIKEQITRVGNYTVKLFVKDSSWAAEDILMITKSFNVTTLDVIDTDPSNNIEGVAETVKCILRFNW